MKYKYVLTRGELEDRDTIDLKECYVGELYTVKPEVGYLRKNDLRIGLIDFVPWGKIVQESGKGKKVIVTYYFNPKKDPPYTARELVTGLSIHVLYMKRNMLLFNRSNDLNDEYDTFVYLHGKLKNPTVEEMWDYIMEHEDVKKYKESLEYVLNLSEMYHNDKKELECSNARKNKVLIKRRIQENIK